MPFDPANPPAASATSLAWATWVFFDRTGATQLEDAQVTARLAMHARVIDGVTYYRPLAAAAEYVTRPEQMTERSRNELSEKFIDPFKVAAEWRSLQADLDAMLPTPSGTSTSPLEFDGRLKPSGW